MELDKILNQIKEVKIQGANNVALTGITLFSANPDKETLKKILAVRPTLLRNSLEFIYKSKNKAQASKKIFNYIEKSEEKIFRSGSTLIKDGMNVFTHCHSSTVMGILKHAKKSGKDFVVYNTETEPLLQGRITAEELAGSGIKVIHLPDTAAEVGLRQCDLFLFGADAYLPKGIINKIGTAMLCEIAKLNNIPAYSCGVSLKFIKKIKIEMRSGKEVWDERNKLIEVENPVFDFTKKELVAGVVCESGIHPYEKFFRLAKKNLKNLKNRNI
jgi:translation initiation factor 2B subunit (eIF-2B alpha/beta/delta family)